LAFTRPIHMFSRSASELCGSVADQSTMRVNCHSQPAGLAPSDVLDIENLAQSLGGGTIYSSPMWLRCWWKHFAPRGTELIVHRLYAGGQLAGVVPLMEHGGWLRQWTAPRNAQSLIVDIMFDPGSLHAWHGLLETFARSAHLLEIGPLPASSPASLGLTRAAEQQRLKHAVSRTTPLALLDLTIGWKTYRSNLSRNLLGNTERVQRRLAALGSVDFQEYTGGPELPALLTECFELEARTWKGAEHSAILSDAATLGFYTDLSLEAAAVGALSLYTLRLNGRLIAFDLCLRRGQWIHDLKFSYEPDMARYAPCNVLRYLFLKREMEAPRARWYELGMQCDWKARWTTSAPLETIRVYSNRLPAQVAWLSGPALRRQLKRIPVLRRTVETVRQFRTRTRLLRRAALKHSLNADHTEKTMSAP
jgi:CelD/BcsL family acetyltransferase involved in cellulose biosynthesis